MDFRSTMIILNYKLYLLSHKKYSDGFSSFILYRYGEILLFLYLLLLRSTFIESI